MRRWLMGSDAIGLGHWLGGARSIAVRWRDRGLRAAARRGMAASVPLADSAGLRAGALALCGIAYTALFPSARRG